MDGRNFEASIARFLVEKTNHNLFLTGKAGTGKTTFLRDVVTHTKKKHVVLAPTGIAAINAGAMTIHSFFQFGFGPYLPGVTMPDSSHKIKQEKLDLINALELIIIDEISMVRADLLDHVDAELRRIRKRQEPFGGVQLLMVGDLRQLPPIAKPEDLKLLQRAYPSPYFFESKALRRTDYHCIELNTVYRQNDGHFLGILNRARNNTITREDLRDLNARYIPSFSPNKDEKYIRLVTHNNQVELINAQEMAKLPDLPFTFQADVKGNFGEDSFPTHLSLELKKGAQVMFVKNDSRKGVVNGTLGEVSYVDEQTLKVKIASGKEIDVEKAEWESIIYTYNEEKKEIEENIAGRFTQYPVRPAWAITIHKSQGLTFDHAIIDVHAAFSPGQAYVALSRCRSLEGIVLDAPLSPHVFITDSLVDDYIKGAAQNLSTLAGSVGYEPFEYEETSTRNVEPASDAELIEVLKSWRKEIASEQHVPAYVVLTDKAILGIATSLPKTIEEILAIHGIGHAKAELYGEKILEIVAKHLQSGQKQTIQQNSPAPELTFAPAEEKRRKPTQQITYELFNQGMSISQIAEARLLTEATICSHLIPFVESGQIDILSLVDETTLKKVKNFRRRHPDSESLRELYDYCNGTIPYHELRFAMAYLNSAGM